MIKRWIPKFIKKQLKRKIDPSVKYKLEIAEELRRASVGTLKDSEKVREIVCKIFNSTNLKSSERERIAKVISDAIVDSHGGRVDCKKLEEELYNIFLDYDCSKFLPYVWLSLYQVAFQIGFLTLAPFLRKKAICSVLKKNNVPVLFRNDYIRRRFLASLEVGDFGLAQEYCLNEEINEARYLFLLDCCLGRLDENFFPAIPRNASFDNEDAFRRYVQNKRVAVVCPAPTGEELGHEIDSCDIVVRMNYRGQEALGPLAEFGGRTDVSFYGGLAGKYNLFEFANQLDFMVGKSSQTVKNILKYCSGKELELSSCLLRHVWSTPPLFNGQPNMLPVVIFDLLRYNPSEVRIFKSDFYAGDKIYYEGYSTNIAKVRLPNLARHDQWSQLCFLRNLRDSGAITVDDKCSEVLDLSIEGYFSRLSNSWLD